MRRAAILATLLLSGCVVGPVFYQYPGASRDAKDEAVLFIAKGDRIVVNELDGKELAGFWTLNGPAGVREIHLLPGAHSVYGRVDKAGAFAWYSFEHNFVAGKRYRLAAKVVGYQLVVGPEEVN